jgi:membrane-associated protease RseP (regulator of RpoE activity)
VALAVFLGARGVAARALGLSPPLLPRGGPLVRRFLVALAGPAGCFVAASLVVCVCCLIFGISRPAHTVVVSVMAGSPADRAGLATGDVLLSVAGVEIDGRLGALGPVVDQQGARAFAVTVDRAGERHTVELRAEGGRMGVMVEPQDETFRSVPASLLEGLTWPAGYSRIALHAYGSILLGSAARPIRRPRRHRANRPALAHTAPDGGVRAGDGAGLVRRDELAGLADPLRGSTAPVGLTLSLGRMAIQPAVPRDPQGTLRSKA